MTQDPHIPLLKKIVRYIVKCLAFLMIVVIFWAALDVVILMYHQIVTEPFLRLNIDHLLAILGAFLAVLVAIEIFLNIILYLTQDVFHVKLVIATALTAAARKVIIIDYTHENVLLIFALAAIIVAVSISYWIASEKEHVRPQ